jgi:hypothetical protein
MNADHRDDLLVMVSGQAPTAESAEVTGLDLDVLHVRVVEAGAERDVVLPWPGPLNQRSDIRTYVVQLHTQALGEK